MYQMIDTIISVIVGGAVTAGQQGISNILQIAFQELKEYLQIKFGERQVSLIEQIENHPYSQDNRDALARELHEAKADQDAELKELVRKLHNALMSIQPGAPTNIENHADQFEVLPIFLDIDSKIQIVVSFPIGPAIDPNMVPIDDLARELSQTATGVQADALINNANRLRLRSDPNFPPEAICISDLPDPKVVGYNTFWFEVVHQASIRGPRMFAALLLNLPLNVWLSQGRYLYLELEKQTRSQRDL